MGGLSEHMKLLKIKFDNVNFSLTNASIGPSFSNSQVEEILRKIIFLN